MIKSVYNSQNIPHTLSMKIHVYQYHTTAAAVVVVVVLFV